MTDTQWWIGLDAWVLEDGNYPDFVSGECRQFALEFGYAPSSRLRLAPATEPGARYTGRTTTYDVAARLIRSADEPMVDAFVLDFGLLAFTQWMVLDDLEPPTAGAWLTGAISLGVDPFMYKDELAGRPGMPALTYSWAIEEIQQRVADPDRESWRTIDRTRTWDDEGPFRLRCTLLGLSG